MIEVVHVVPDLGVGGAERVVVDLVTHLDRTRFAPHLVCLFDPKGTPLEAELAEAGVACTHLGKRPGFDRRMPRAVAGALRSLAPGVVHTHRYAVAYALPAIVARRVPAVHTHHTVPSLEMGRSGRVPFRLAAGLRAVRSIAISQAVAREVWRTYGVAAHAVITNGVALERFATPTVDRDTWRARNGIGAEEVVVVCVARLSGVKNHLGLVRAFARVQTPCRLVLVGDGEQRGPVRDEIRALDLSDRVTLLGTRSDVVDVLHASDVATLFSVTEGLGISVIEAMATGLPVIGSDAGGIPELIEHGRSGLVVPSGDEAALADALDRLAGDADLRRRLGERSRVLSADRSLTAMVRAYEAVYTGLAAR